MSIDEIIAGLVPMERERITGWKGPPGAAYNAVSEALFERGLLNSNWTLTETGKKVRARLEEQSND